MRFISAFIFTLLSASTLLAQGLCPSDPCPYAGFHLGVDQAHPVKYINATFRVPKINCRVGDVAYVGVAIGLFCTSVGGIEAGVHLTCHDTPTQPRLVQRPYWRSDFNVTQFWRSYETAQGDEIQVQAQVLDGLSGTVKVLIQNLTRSWKLSPWPLKAIGSRCQFTASWFLRAELEDGNLNPIPSFDEIVLYDLSMVDSTKNSHGTSKAKQLTMTDSQGKTIASAYRSHTGPQPNRNIHIYE